MAVGRRPAPDLGRVRFVEAGGVAEVLAAVDAGGIDLAILDGEAQPTGGMGVSRQLKNEIDDCPPIIVTVRRRDDRWLATWSQADAVLVHPLDPLTAAETVADVLRRARRRACPAPRLTAAPCGRSRTWPALLGRLIAAQRPRGRRHRLGDGPGALRRGHARPAGRVPRRAARQGRDRRGDRRAGRGDAAARPPGRRCPAAPSTSSAPAATRRTPSTSRRWRRSSWPRPGVPVVKHGNRAASSASGAADVLEALGVAIDLPPDGVAALRRARSASGSASRRCSTRRCATPAGPRRELGVPTAMNVLGPLTNPAPAAAPRWSAARTPRLAPVLAEVFAGRGASALVVRGDDGLDELTTTTHQHRVGGRRRRGAHARRSTRPRSACPRPPARTCAAATPAHNAEVFRALVGGAARTGARRGAAQRRRRAGRAFDGRRPRRPGRRVPRGAGARGRGDRLRGGGASCSTRWVKVSTAQLRRTCTRGPASRCAERGVREDSEADGERGLGVGARSRSGRRCGCRCAARPSTLLSRPGDHVGQLLVLADLDHRDEVDVACARVDLGRRRRGRRWPARSRGSGRRRCGPGRSR